MEFRHWIAWRLAHACLYPVGSTPIVLPTADLINLERAVLRLRVQTWSVRDSIAAGRGRDGRGVSQRGDTRLGREVAIKILPAHLSADPARKLRFEREAKGNGNGSGSGMHWSLSGAL